MALRACSDASGASTDSCIGSLSVLDAEKSDARFLKRPWGNFLGRLALDDESVGIMSCREIRPEKKEDEEWSPAINEEGFWWQDWLPPWELRSSVPSTMNGERRPWFGADELLDSPALLVVKLSLAQNLIDAKQCSEYHQISSEGSAS